MQLSFPPEVSDDNLVRICLDHASRGTNPSKMRADQVRDLCPHIEQHQ